MSVYNGAPYLHEAIKSILGQTWSDFEFIIINDGSTDDSLQIINSFNDPRIIVIDQENIGLADSLNKGLDLAQGDLIARMDADDISLPYRLQKQIEFMINHPMVGVCGSWVKTVGGAEETVWSYPEKDEDIKATMIFESPPCTPFNHVEERTVQKAQSVLRPFFQVCSGL